MAKKIKKENIKKYVGAVLVGSFIVSGMALNIYDENFDHTKEECLICKLWSTPTHIGEEVATMGISHQMREIAYYYDSIDEDVALKYENNHTDYNENYTRLVEMPSLDGKTRYNVNGDYEVVEIDGIKYAVTKNPVGDKYKAIITEHLNDNNEVVSEDVLKIGK